MAGGSHAVRIGCELPQCLHICRKPGQTMGSALFAVEQAPDNTALHRHARAQLGGRVFQQTLHGAHSTVGHGQQVVPGLAGERLHHVFRAERVLDKGADSSPAYRESKPGAHAGVFTT